MYKLLFREFKPFKRMLQEEMQDFSLQTCFGTMRKKLLHVTQLNIF